MLPNRAENVVPSERPQSLTDFEKFQAIYQEEQRQHAANLCDVAQQSASDNAALRLELMSQLNALTNQVERLQKKHKKLKQRIKTAQQLHDEMLLDACQQGDYKKMQLLLDLGADPVVVSNDGLTPFYISVLNHHYDLASALLKLNTGVIELPNREDKTILQVMSEKGDIDAVRFIIDNMPKLDKNAKPLVDAYNSAEHCAAHNPLASTAIKQIVANAMLFQAAKHGNHDLAIQAISKRADKNARNGSFDTPLHIAAHAGHAEVVRYLLSLHASIVMCNRHNETALEVASNLDVKNAIASYQKKTATLIQGESRGFLARTMFVTRLHAHREKLQTQASRVIRELTQQQRFADVLLLTKALTDKRFQQAAEMMQRYKANLPLRSFEIECEARSVSGHVRKSSM